MEAAEMMSYPNKGFLFDCSHNYWGSQIIGLFYLIYHNGDIETFWDRALQRSTKKTFRQICLFSALSSLYHIHAIYKAKVDMLLPACWKKKKKKKVH